jgi:glutamate-ammonia-ligase adenylyltransferase
MLDAALESLLVKKLDDCRVALAGAGFAEAPAALAGARLRQLVLASEFCTDVLCRFPAECAVMAAAGEFDHAHVRPYYAAALAAELAGVTDETDWMQRIRRYRNRQMLRWVYRDVNGLCSLEELTDELSEFAEASVDAAIAFAEGPLKMRHGEPVGEDSGQIQRLVVLGMGKLGAQELNLSSDIDLIFSYAEPGETNGKFCISNQEYFIKLGQGVIRLLDQVTADGFVFRIDMRLRPWGDGSALALSFTAMERYYEQHGREWERYAFIKARPIAGDLAGGEELLATLRPFVYRRYIDFSAFAALREMKGMIEREVRRKDMADNVKLGSGGIRDVEFIAQAFQLIRGGVHKALQQRPLLPVMDVLVELGLLPAAVRDDLAAAYRFLRQVEHRIQALHDHQTQLLPLDPAGQARLAASLGFADWTEFYATLERHRDKVREQFRLVVVERVEAKTATPAGDKARALWLDSCDVSAEVMAELGFKQPAESAERLQALRSGRALRTLPLLSRERLDQFMPLLIEEISAHAESDLALTRCLPLVESVLRRTSYLVMLLENPAALQRMVTLCAASPWIADELSRYPVLLDELLNAETLYTPPQKEQLLSELRQQLLRVPQDDVEEQMRVLRIFKKSHVLRVAASDLQGTLPLMKVSDYLSWIAEAVLESVVGLSWQQMSTRYGFPRRPDGSLSTGDFMVAGYGKLGGIELGYGSDLDLVFVHNVASDDDTDGPKPISGGEFYARMAQKIISLLTTSTSAGQLYEVDMRLRPSGNSGMLVSSLKAQEEYQLNHAWTWEHQALVRARLVAGDEALGHLFDDLRRRVLCQPRDLAKLRAEVLEMRQKMRDHLSSTAKNPGSHVFDLKHDAGGIVDIEFMVQYGVLAWANTYPELACYSDNVRILDGFAACGCMPADLAVRLKEAYLAFRAQSHRLALAQQPARVSPTEFVEIRALVQQCWNNLFEIV